MAGFSGDAEIEGDGGDSVRSQGLMARLQQLLPANTAASLIKQTEERGAIVHHYTDPQLTRLTEFYLADMKTQNESASFFAKVLKRSFR